MPTNPTEPNLFIYLQERLPALLADKFYKTLHDAWPQINGRTHLVATPSNQSIQVTYLADLDVRVKIPEVAWVARPGLAARLWRILGELTGHMPWLRRGQTACDISVPPLVKQTLPWRTYSFNLPSLDGFDVFTLRAAYDPLQDTLYFELDISQFSAAEVSDAPDRNRGISDQ